MKQKLKDDIIKSIKKKEFPIFTGIESFVEGLDKPIQTILYSAVGTAVALTGGKAAAVPGIYLLLKSPQFRNAFRHAGQYSNNPFYLWSIFKSIEKFTDED